MKSHEKWRAFDRMFIAPERPLNLRVHTQYLKMMGKVCFVKVADVPAWDITLSAPSRPTLSDMWITEERKRTATYLVHWDCTWSLSHPAISNGFRMPENCKSNWLILMVCQHLADGMRMRKVLGSGSASGSANHSSSHEKEDWLLPGPLEYKYFIFICMMAR